MKSKNLIIIAIIFLCLTGLILVKKAVKEEVATEDVAEKIVGSNVDLDTIDNINIYFENKEKKMELVKEKSMWKEKSRGLFVKKENLISFIKSINELEGEVRSGNKELFPDYGIQDSEGLHIELNKEGISIKHLVMGTNKPDRNRIFVRFAESDKVYVAESGILNDLGFWREIKSENLNTGKWIDKKLFHFYADQIEGIRIEKVSDKSTLNTVEVERKDVDGRKKWETREEYPFTVSAVKIKDYLKELLDVKFSKEMDLEEGHFDNDTTEIELFTDDGNKITVKRGDKDKNDVNYYIKMSGFECLFLMPVNTFNKIIKTNGDFFIDNPLGIEIEDVNKIEGDLVEKNKKIEIIKDKENQETWVNPEGTTIAKELVKGLIEELQSLTLATWGKKEEIKGKFSTLTITLSEKVWDLDFFESITIDSQGYNPVVFNGSDKKYYIETQKVERILENAKNL